MGKIEWTPTMVRMMKDYYPIVFNKSLAKWLGVSLRTLERKARELNLNKINDFNKARERDISKLISTNLKKAYKEGRKESIFKKGVRNNIKGEFKRGHVESKETHDKRINAIRKAYEEKRKTKEILKRYK